MKTILVTGGAGFVGSHACKALARAGYLPVTMDNLERGHEASVKWGPLERADIRDISDLRRIFTSWSPWATMHFAAYAYVGESNEEPLKYYQNNVGGSANLLRACAEFGCDNFIFSSSCATYGRPIQLPVTEDQPQAPINPYGRTKLIVEQMLRETEAAHGVRHVTLRYFNAAGADPDGEIGEDHSPETHLVPLVLLAALHKERSVSIFGDDYETPDGTCVRDYVHVVDLATAHVEAVKWLESGGKSASFNLCNEHGHSVSEIVRAAEKITKAKINVAVSPRRAGDPAALVGSSAKARDVLGWRPVYPDISQQIEHAWRWFGKTRPGSR